MGPMWCDQTYRWVVADHMATVLTSATRVGDLARAICAPPA